MDHHVAHPEEQLPAERAARVELGEVLAPEALHHEQRDGQRVAERQRHGGARGRREIVRARLLGDAASSATVATRAKRGIQARR